MPNSSYPRIPYGWADFRAIGLEKRLYVDKTRFVHALGLWRSIPTCRLAMCSNSSS